jgi:hypothetical protein
VKFSSVVFIQIFSPKNANSFINEIHVENDYFPLPSMFEMCQYITFLCNIKNIHEGFLFFSMLHFLVLDNELFICLFICLFITIKTHIVKQFV